MYTDGLHERRDADPADTFARLAAAEAAASLPLDEFADHLLKLAIGDDDVALLALRTPVPALEP